MTRYRNAAAFLLLAALWGASYPAVKAGLEGFPPLLFAALRFDLVGLLVLGYAVARGGRWRPTRADAPSIFAGGTLFIAVHNGLLFIGQGYVTSAVSAVVLSSIPVLSAGFARPVLPSERLSPVALAGVLLGLVGVVVVANPDPNAVSSPNPVGVGILLLSASAFALGGVATRQLRTTLPVAAYQGWLMLLGGLLLHGMSLARAEPQAVDLSPSVVAAFVYLVPFAGAVGYLLYFDLLDRLGPVEINLVGYVSPVFAAVVGWAALNESLAPSVAVGFAVIVVGFLLVKRDAIRAEFA
ncbi:Permease of the drug/metabolite transporter (DMT) superfamily [Halogranum gelatinilyticum]|uniref:Permease of the drug/metabolite transporter (DMT) superfamily n=1 Tax=Halogranum gelatinilyticum TaxID=660521 RepID=A0A1G9P3C1_9EURY|nr:DMT family transporter [Halogranum gelatinilyticum]SDL92737.1 Permease of the drug/metabolite transporter (DMT) superfamily [Halogranum gelatinilyticum]